jgi:hypothetical protein
MKLSTVLSILRLHAFRAIKKLHYLAIAGAMLLTIGGTAAIIMASQNDKANVITATSKGSTKGQTKSGVVQTSNTLGTTTNVSNANNSSNNTNIQSKPGDKQKSSLPTNTPRNFNTPKKPSFNLKSSSANVALGGKYDFAFFEVSTDNGMLISPPTATTSAELWVHVDIYSPWGNGLDPRKTWAIGVHQYDPNTSGRGTVTITSGSSQVTVPVTWSPVASFDANKGSLVRTETADTITHTANFTVTMSNFTNDMLFYFYTTGPCINTNNMVKTVTYNGQNNYAIACTVRRLVATPPGPLPNEALLKVHIQAFLPSDTINSIRSSVTLDFTLAPSYDR